MSSGLHSRVVDGLGEIAPERWDALSDGGNPFVRHAFLLALERHGCLGQAVGWFPRHLICEDDAGDLAGALPRYLKGNSFGEFVFDWSWAHAHERAGLPYYPKSVIAVPFTPATGPRLLVKTGGDRESVARELIGAAIREAEERELSSVHWLFANDPELSVSHELLVRKGCQFHWENPGYRDFGDFLDSLSAKRRKEVKRERRAVTEAGVSIVRVAGHRATESDWNLFHRLYRRTFAKHGNYAALRLAFFRELGSALGPHALLLFAQRAGRSIAGALCVRGADTLYGRYWGALEEIPALHFEVCYYQGIEYCIEQPLKRFEPGAQGEHKISRGFDPRATWSYHWIADRGLRDAIAHHLRHETAEVDRYMHNLGVHSAYRRSF